MVQHLTIRSSNIRLVCAPTAADILLPRALLYLWELFAASRRTVGEILNGNLEQLAGAQTQK
jgi:hypothetical protein